MKRDAIDFKNEKVAVLFRRLLLPTLLVPSFVLLPLWIGTEGIWLAMPAAELLTTLLILVSLLPSRQSASSN